MSEILTAINFDPDNLTALSGIASDVVASANAVPIFNITNFVVNGMVVFGQGEQAELMTILNTSGETLNLTASLAFAHRKNQLVRQLVGNEIDFYYAADVGTGFAPPDANFSLLGTAIITPDQEYTSFLHQAGGSGYWYKYIYKNTITTSTTDLADAVAVRGGGYGRLVSIKQVMAETGIKDQDQVNVDLASLSAFRDAAEDEVKGKLMSAGYLLPLQTQNGLYFIPPIVTNITRKLAAGLYLMQNFGTTRPGSSKNGKDKADEARNLLAEIQLNDLVLVDPTGNMMAKPALIDGYPDETTTETNPDGKLTSGPLVTMDKVF